MITASDGVVRLDDTGLESLLAHARGDRADPETSSEIAAAGLEPALDALRDPVVTLEVVVAGTTRLQHRVWVVADRAVVVLAVRPQVHQVIILPPSHLAAALVRMTGLRPSRTADREPRTWSAQATEALVADDADQRGQALELAGAAVAWRLRVGWAGERRSLTVVDGPAGPHVVDDEDGLLLPSSPTSLYRVFSTVLPPAALQQED